MKLFRVVAAMLLTLGLMSNAGAATFVQEVGSLTVFGDLAKPKGSFVDTYTFTLDAPSDVSGLFLSYGIKGLDYKLESTGYSSSGSLFGGLTSFSFENLAAGIYELTLDGWVGRKVGGYIGLFAVAAVPEAETWALMIAGGLLLAFALHRRRGSFEEQLPLQFAA